MSFGRNSVVSLAAAVALVGCQKKHVDVNPIVPAMKVNRDRAPLGGALEVTYTWTTESGAKPIGENYRAFVHFVGEGKTVLFSDDHVPVPPPDQWKPGQTYTYTRTVFVPVIPFVGPARLVMGLYPSAGKGDRIALKGDDIGMLAYKVGSIELLPQTDNVFLVYKEGWYGPEASPGSPGSERMWTKKEATVSFKNPKRDVVVYLEADTNYKAFTQPPVLTVGVGSGAGTPVLIESSEVFLKKIRFTAEQLGTGEWVDLKLAMNQSFVPKTLGLNTDERELGLLVYHLNVQEADKLGTVPALVDAQTVAPVVPAAKPTAPAKAAATKRK
jgi:hypothetical protein